MAGPFSTEHELASWLAAHGVPAHEYGQGQAKSVADLLTEVLKGESALQLVEGAPARAVTVLTLHITNERGQVLTEAKQQLPDGRVRSRGIPLSEKLLPGEDWREAALRAVAEELGSALQEGWQAQFKLDESSHAVVTERMASPSYPGLVTLYTMHRASAALPCLPQGPFDTQEAAGGGVLRTWWEWRAAGQPP